MKNVYPFLEISLFKLSLCYNIYIKTGNVSNIKYIMNCYMTYFAKTCTSPLIKPTYISISSDLSLELSAQMITCLEINQVFD